MQDEGDSKISFNNFPANWPINGSWKFNKDGKKCMIKHESYDAIMKWNCD